MLCRNTKKHFFGTEEVSRSNEGVFRFSEQRTRCERKKDIISIQQMEKNDMQSKNVENN